MKYHILYNPLAGHGSHDEKLSAIKAHINGECVEHYMTEIECCECFISNLDPDDKIIISGGDGTLNKFINAVDTDNLNNEVYYYASGSGNDFLHDVEKEKGYPPFIINQYLKNLPTVTVKGKTYKFINGIGYGIDGYACEMGDKKKEQGKAVNYTTIAIKGLLYDYKPRNAVVKVDGVEYKINKVWIAPTMHGRYYGGGMMPAPGQDRLGDGLVTFVGFGGSSILKTLSIFPSFFKGGHLKHKKYLTLARGREVTVTFDSPCALQIDGETILDVTSYTVHAGINK